MAEPQRREQDRPQIAIRGLKKSFGPKVVLDGVDLDIAAGESLVVIGASGTGKSVLLKHIVGLMKPDAGSVEVDGVEIAKLGYRELTDFRRKFGMSFQEGALFDSMSVAENVAFPLKRLTKKSKDEIRQRVEECLALVQLPGIGDRMPSQLSGGMRRRVGFARAIAQVPEILLFDEPTTGLDPVTTAQINEVIVSMNDQLKATMVTITHDMESAYRIGDRIAMLDRGKIVAAAPPAEFKELSDPRIQQFLHGRAEGPLTEASRHAAAEPAPAGQVE